MPIVGRLDQYASILADEFDETTANNPSITGLGTYYASEFSENVGITTTLVANVFPPYDPVYDEFAGVLYGPGQGTFMRQNTDKSVIVYNEIDEVTNFAGETLVTSGLILRLDAGNPASYPGSGTTWFDLSGSGNNATLINGPTFTNVYGGSFLMDNNNDQISLGGINWNTLGSTRNFTFMFVARKTEYGTGGNNTGDSGFFVGAANGFNNGWRIVESNGGTPGNSFSGTQTYYFGSPSSSSTVSVSDTINGRFAICAFTQNGTSAFGFLNGNTSTATFGAYSNGVNYALVSDNFYGIGKFTGYISCIFAYNRALTAAEITQNYNAIKKRFGL